LRFRVQGVGLRARGMCIWGGGRWYVCYIEREEQSYYRICTTFPTGCHHLGSFKRGFFFPQKMDVGATPPQVTNGSAPPPGKGRRNLIASSTQARRDWELLAIGFRIGHRGGAGPLDSCSKRLQCQAVTDFSGQTAPIPDPEKDVKVQFHIRKRTLDPLLAYVRNNLRNQHRRFSAPHKNTSC